MSKEDFIKASADSKLSPEEMMEVLKNLLSINNMDLIGELIIRTPIVKLVPKQNEEKTTKESASASTES